MLSIPNTVNHCYAIVNIIENGTRLTGHFAQISVLFVTRYNIMLSFSVRYANPYMKQQTEKPMINLSKCTLLQ